MRSRNQQKKPLTYEELARRYDITPNKAHSVVKSAYNKMVKSLMDSEKLNIFDAVLALREYFNMTEVEAVEKLNDEHREMLTKYASDEYHIKTNKNDPFSELFSG
jgi:hypothetical protein